MGMQNSTESKHRKQMHILRQHCVSTQVVSVARLSCQRDGKFLKSISKLRHGHLRHDYITLNTITLELMGIFVSVCESNS